MRDHRRAPACLEGSTVMSDPNDFEHYKSREQQERALTAAAVDPAVRAVHLEMAERYAALVREAAPVRLVAAHSG